MNLFISWSGEFSKRVAECLKVWIPTIIQTVEVFCSSEDIAKGENWSNRLSKELEQSNFGIVCLTPENVQAPWIHFEAGALSKVSSSRVSAIMLGINPSDVKGPLARFQNTAFNREEFYRLFQSINDSHENPLKQAILDHAFDNSWEKLEHDIAAIIKDYPPHSPAPVPEKSKHDELSSNSDALQELLRLVRNLDNQLQLVRNLDNGRNVPTSSPTQLSIFNSNEPSRISDDEETIRLACSKEYVDKAMSIIRKYVRSEPMLDYYHNKLTKLRIAYIQIPKHLSTEFKREMKEFAPEVDVVSI